jgi:hypothetical protein
MIEAESLMTAPSPVTLDDHASPQGATLLAEPTSLVLPSPAMTRPHDRRGLACSTSVSTGTPAGP